MRLGRWMQRVAIPGWVMVAVAAGVALASLFTQGRAVVLIGAVYPTGGAQGLGGVEEFRGLSLAVEFANRRGGWRGLPIRLRLEPADAWDAAPAAVERLARAGLQVVVGSYGSTISRPAAATASRLGLFFWETGAVGEFGMDTARGTRVFRFSPSGESLGRAAVAFVQDALAPRLRPVRLLRFSIAYVDDVYGRAVARGAVDELRRRGLRPEVVLPYTPQNANYEGMAAQIAGAHTDVLIVATYVADGVALRRAVQKTGVPLVANIGCSAYCMDQFGRLLGPDVVGLFASDKPDGTMLDPNRLSREAAAALRWGREQYTRRYSAPLSGAALSGFAGGLALLQHVLPRASQLTAEEVARAALEVRLPVGTLPNGSGLEFAPPGTVEAGTNLRALSVICQWVTPAARAVVWPLAFATHPIVLPPVR
jgi:branched-chain amino acid transport system substrate-binding protein